MTDRELLEAAARAAGIEDVDFYDCVAGYYPCQFEGGIPKWWNPLLDDGDALRLAVKLRLAVFTPENDLDDATVSMPELDGEWISEEGTDPYAATRRAIVRAAAAIGKGMKPPAPTLPDSLSDEEHVRGLEGRAS